MEVIVTQLHVYHIVIQKAQAALHPCSRTESAPYSWSPAIAQSLHIAPYPLLTSAVKCNLPLSSVMKDFSHVQVLSAAGCTDWITVSRDLKKTRWTSNRVLGPPLWTALAMEVTNHWMYRGRRQRVLVSGYIYLPVCLSVPFCVYRYKLCGWCVHANMHICEPVWACVALAPSTLQKKALSLFSYPS